MRKQVIIKLRFVGGVGGGADSYIVTKVVNTTELHPGQSLTRRQLDELNARRDVRTEVEA